MKTLSKTSFIFLLVIFVAFTNAFAQNKVVVVKEKHPRNKTIVVKSKNHKISKAKFYQPHWSSKAKFYRRWVYFPRHNFYWDNLNNVYVIRAGRVWVTSTTAPKEIENINLTKEKKVELSEENDVLDSIQQNNEMHQKKYISN